MTIINYTSSIVNKLKASLNDDARVVIYDLHMFTDIVNDNLIDKSHIQFRILPFCVLRFCVFAFLRFRVFANSGKKSGKFNNKFSTDVEPII